MTDIPLDELAMLLRDASDSDDPARLVEARASIREGRRDGVAWIRAVQLFRDLGAIDPDVAHYLVALFSEEMVSTVVFTDPELVEAGERMEAVEAEHGLGKDEFFLIGDAPAEWDAERLRWDARFERLQVKALRDVGEAEMALELLIDRDRYDERTSRGRDELFGTDELFEQDEPFGPDELFGPDDWVVPER